MAPSEPTPAKRRAGAPDRREQPGGRTIGEPIGTYLRCPKCDSPHGPYRYGTSNPPDSTHVCANCNAAFTGPAQGVPSGDSSTPDAYALANRRLIAIESHLGDCGPGDVPCPDDDPAWLTFLFQLAVIGIDTLRDDAARRDPRSGRAGGSAPGDSVRTS